MNTSPYLLTTTLRGAFASLAIGTCGAMAQTVAAKPAQQCLSDLTVFDSQHRKFPT